MKDSNKYRYSLGHSPHSQCPPYPPRSSSYPSNRWNTPRSPFFSAPRLRPCTHPSRSTTPPGHTKTASNENTDISYLFPFCLVLNSVSCIPVIFQLYCIDLQTLFPGVIVLYNYKTRSLTLLISHIRTQVY